MWTFLIYNGILQLTIYLPPTYPTMSRSISHLTIESNDRKAVSDEGFFCCLNKWVRVEMNKNWNFFVCEA